MARRKHIFDSDLIEMHRFYWMWSLDTYGKPHFDIPVVEIAEAFGLSCGRYVSDLLAETTLGGSFFRCTCGGSINARNRDRFLAGEFRCVDCGAGWFGEWARGGKLGQWIKTDPERQRRIDMRQRYQRATAYTKLIEARSRLPAG